MTLAGTKDDPRHLHNPEGLPSNHHAFSSAGMHVKLPVPLLSQHAKRGDRIGDVVLIRKSVREVYCRAMVYENNAAADYAWKLIQDGTVRCFSISSADDQFRHVQGVVDGITFYDRWRLREVSICRKGANPDCVSEIDERIAAPWA